MALTPKQKKFCDYYIETGNATEAAKRAGYAEKNARIIGAQNLSNINISTYLAKRMASQDKKRVADADEVLAFYTSVLRGQEKDQFGLDASLSDRIKAADSLAKRHEHAEKWKAAEKEKEAARASSDENFDIPSRLLAKEFVDVHRAVLNHKYTEYMLKGGRGSTKSSYVALEILCLMKRNPQLNAVVLRKVGNTLRMSVYNQTLWAIDVLGLSEEVKATVSPMEITFKATGQKIFFAGLDDPLKLKSIKPEKGYGGIVWFEELDQFAGDEECRNVIQSVIRGGDTAYIFKTFNPPKTKNNWANMDADIPKESRLVCHTDYTTVPEEWLGQAFLDAAEDLQEINPAAYEHEYLGIANGNGGMVFENVVAQAITDDQISRFDRPLGGVDWGYYPDPWAFNHVHYDAARRTLYIFGELTTYKKGNRDTADMLFEYGITETDMITADSAEPKSVGDYRAYGLNCKGAVKGPGSVDYSFKWLQALVAIVIDPVRCPDTYEEFIQYEYERTKDGDIISGYPDADNHHIDAVRYATEQIWKRKGE